MKIKYVTQTFLFLILQVSLNSQTWQYYNESNVGDYIVGIVEDENEDVFSLTSNRNDIHDGIKVRKHSGLTGNVEKEFNYSNDSLETKFHSIFYFGETEKLLLIGEGRDYRNATSLGDVESYFMTLVFDNELELEKENITYMSDRGIHISFLNASLKSNGDIIVVANQNVFPFTGFYQNLFIELNRSGEILNLKKDEPTEDVFDNTQFWITENLENNGFISMGQIHYKVDDDLNLDTLVIDEFSIFAADYDRGDIKILNDSLYICYSADLKPSLDAIQIATLNSDFEIVDCWLFESDYDVTVGTPLDFISEDFIFIVSGYMGSEINAVHDKFNFQLIQLNRELEPQWIKVFGAIDDGKSIYPYDVTVTQDGGVLVGGHVKYLADNGGWSNANEFIIKFDENGTTPTSELPSGIASLIMIFPNPTTDFMTITNDQSRDLEFKIYDVAGRLISTQQMSALDANITIETHSLTAGSYILHTISDDRQIDSYQFIKQ